MADDAITAGEVARSLKDFREEMRGDVTSLREELRSNHHSLRNAIAGLAFVTHAEFQGHKDTAAERQRSIDGRLATLEKRVEADDEDRRATRRIAWTSLAAPLIVGLVFFLLQWATR